MDEAQKHEIGAAILARIDAHRADPNARAREIAAAVVQTQHSEAEAKFFGELDTMRENDPDAFARVSSPMKVAYMEWKRSQR